MIRTKTTFSALPLAAMAEAMNEAARGAVRRAALDVAARARELVHDRSGALAASIGIREDGEGLVVEAIAPHARFVELGTARAPARPFLAPALGEIGPSVAEAIARAIAGTRA